MQHAHCPRRVCVDLERCILVGDFGAVGKGQPPVLPATVRVLRQLKLKGDYIIVHTYEPDSKSSSIESVLRRSEVPFDEIVYNKVVADVTVCRNVVHPSFMDGNELLGIEDGSMSSNRGLENNGFIPSRSFNAITVSADNVVSKSSSAAPILGELFFYSHMPADIAHLFPTVLAEKSAFALARDPPTSAVSSLSGSDDDLIEGISLTQSCAEFAKRSQAPSISIQMTRIRGPTFSHLLTARCLTPGRLIKLLTSLQLLHSSGGLERPCKCSSSNVNIYENYSRKLRHRLKKHKAIYEELASILTTGHILDLMSFLGEYEAEDRGLAVRVVHGDPVLCNILSERDGGVKFVDMRGMQGDSIFTLEGDAAYDLAKCWQSLSGYDYIVRNRSAAAKDAEICWKLQNAFRLHVKKSYPGINYRDIVLITASLYVTLIPLHDSQQHRIMFAQRAVTLLKIVSESYTRGEVDLSASTKVDARQYRDAASDS